MTVTAASIIIHCVIFLFTKYLHANNRALPRAHKEHRPRVPRPESLELFEQSIAHRRSPSAGRNDAAPADLAADDRPGRPLHCQRRDA